MRAAWDWVTGGDAMSTDRTDVVIVGGGIAG
jgi:glycerol-3-phosphate dehydrogenase